MTDRTMTMDYDTMTVRGIAAVGGHLVPTEVLEGWAKGILSSPRGAVRAGELVCVLPTDLPSYNPGLYDVAAMVRHAEMKGDALYIEAHLLAFSHPPAVLIQKMAESKEYALSMAVDKRADGSFDLKFFYPTKLANLITDSST